MAILKIVELILKMIDRYLGERQRTRIERENDEFKKHLANNDLELIADRLGSRLREYQSRHPKRS